MTPAEARGRIWAARAWVVVLGIWRRLSSSWSFLSAGPILLGSCWAAFAWFCGMSVSCMGGDIRKVCGIGLGAPGGAKGGRYVFEDGPVEDVVVLESFTDEKIPEEFAQVSVIGFIIESQRPSIIQEDGKFIGKSPA
jgi:hypothetical protein